MLELREVEVAYGNIRALKGISLTVAEGELVTLIGSNGAGKSTTLKTISGLLRPKSGTLSYRGQPLDRLPPHKIVALGISHCPEGRHLFGRLTVVENLRLGAVQRRNRPHLLLLDEPSLGLAPILVGVIFDTIRQLKREGATILLVEQNAHLALEIADRAYVMETGRVTLQGPAMELKHNPQVERTYLGT
jgi:branched-chain amino acid transport system ATP-binding protein